jgi:xanthine dehydrogenase accessory factor
MFDDFFSKAHELVQRGVPFVTATVVRSERPTSGKPGDKAIITIDGVMHGWIGGSCAQPTVISEALKSLAADEARLIRLSTDPEAQEARSGLIDLPMICFSGGTLEIYLEPQQPRPRLLIVGTLPVARALAHLGRAMNYHTTVVDLDSIGVEYADDVLTSLDGVAAQIRPLTYVVVATHGNYDELALEKILPLHPTYVGLVASPTRATAVRDYLIQSGLSETDLLPLKSPAGLDIQARRGDEIALSIMAEIVQRRRNAELLDLALFHTSRGEATGQNPTTDQPTPPPVASPTPQSAVGSEQAAEEQGSKGAEENSPLATPHSPVSIALTMVDIPTVSGRPSAVDPICGMSVEIAIARYTHVHGGTIYYFCCAGCKAEFIRSPEKYLVRS